MRQAAIAGVTLLAAVAAWATIPALHLTQEVCFLAGDAGQAPRDSLSKSVELQNQGSTTIWCALVNKADAVEMHSRSIGPTASWAIDAAGQLAIWCRAGGGVDQQPSLDGGANGTADGGPAGCTIISNAH